jgi:hypothetical protein
MLKKFLKERLNKLKVFLIKYFIRNIQKISKCSQSQFECDIKFQVIESSLFLDSSERIDIIIKNIEGLNKSKIIFQSNNNSFGIAIMRESHPNLKLTIDPTYKKIIPEEYKY